MNIKLLAALAASALSLTFVSCSQRQAPHSLSGYPKATPITLDTTDCKLICGRVSGVSKGVKVFGIPMVTPSEMDAVTDMYQSARNRGCKLEGESVVFANASVEQSSAGFIITRPTIKVTGDLVQYVGNTHLQNRSISVDATNGSSAATVIGGMLPF